MGLRLLTTARPFINADDIQVPEGYKVEAVVAELSFPCGMGFTDDSTLFILEGGSTWPTHPACIMRSCYITNSSCSNTCHTSEIIIFPFTTGLLGLGIGLAFKFISKEYLLLPLLHCP